MERSRKPEEARLAPLPLLKPGVETAAPKLRIEELEPRLAPQSLSPILE